MRDLSLVIRADENDVAAYINAFDVLLQDNKTELIIINNKIQKLYTRYRHSLYRFSEEHNVFKEFCFSAAQGKKVMIVEKGMEFTPGDIEKIKESIEQMSYCNLTCSFKRHIHIDEHLSFEDEGVIVYSRGIKGFNKNIGITVDDYFLTDFNKNDIGTILEKLIKYRHYNELYLWYERVILEKPDEYKMEFYNVLELKKDSLNEDEVKTIENLFSQGAKNYKYLKFLDLKRIHGAKETGWEVETQKCIRLMDLREEDLYFSWLINGVVNEGGYVIELLAVLDDRLCSKFIDYLFNSNKSFSSSIFKFIVKADSSGMVYKEGGTGMKVFLGIIKAYVRVMSGKSDEPGERNKLLQILYVYMTHSIKMIDKFKAEGISLLSADEAVFIAEIGRAQEKLSSKSVTDALTILKSVCTVFPLFDRAIYYYMQKIRFENDCYPYKLSICMIVKDEEKNIERCLSSLKPLVENKIAELVIVDTGSTDKTIKISEKYTDKVLIHPWQGSFSEARNYSMAAAEGEYILIMDADEEIRKHEVMKLISEFSSPGYKSYNTFTIKLINYTDLELKNFAVMTQPRIFKNNGQFYYSSTVHNQPVFNLPIKNLDVNVIHYGYIMTDDIREKKFQRTATLLKKELEKNPKNIYYRFQLSTSYAMYGDAKEALNQARIYMRLIKEESVFNEDYLMHYNNAVSIYIANLIFDEALEVCDEALKICPWFIDFIYYKALILFNREQCRSALVYIGEYLSLIDNFYKSDIANDGRYSFYTLGFKDDVLRMKSVCNYRTGEYEKCIDSASLIKDEAMMKNCLYVIINSCFQTNKYNELALFYKLRILNSSDAGMCKIFNYCVLNNLFKLTGKMLEECITLIKNSGLDKKYIKGLKSRLKKGNSFEPEEILDFVDIYNIDNLDIKDARVVYNGLMPQFDSFAASVSESTDEIRKNKRFAQFVLHRSSKLIFFTIYNMEKIVDIFSKYIKLCSTLMKMGRRDLLEARERCFLANILDGLKLIGSGDFENAAGLIEGAPVYYMEMEGLIKLILPVLIPQQGVSNSTGREISEVDEEIFKYASAVKQKILQSSCSGYCESLAGIFNEYDRTDLYDAELYSLKAVVLMSENLTEEAEKVLTQGDERYPGDSRIINNLIRLNIIMKDYKKSVEIYSRAKIINPDIDLLDINELIQEEETAKDNLKLKVLHGTIELTEKINEMTNALQRKGICARTLNYYPRSIKYTSDYVMDVNTLKTGGEILKGTAFAASRLVSEYGIFHFHFGTTMNFEHSDLQVLKELNRKVFMHFWGYDVRMHSMAKKINPYAFNGTMDDDRIKRKLEMMSKYVTRCIVNDHEIYQYVRDYFRSIDIVMPMIDISNYKPGCFTSNKRLLIVHAPASPELKGTVYIQSAVEGLKSRYDFDFKIINGMPHEDAKKVYEEADLIIDQLMTGSYGRLSMEAMAMGKPVICYISDFMADKYPKELPIISANPDNIKEKLEYVIKNRDMLTDIGKKGRLYVEKHHDINKGIDKIIDLYKS